MSLLLVVLIILLVQLYRSTSKLEKEINEKQQVLDAPNVFTDPSKRYKRTTSLPRNEKILVSDYEAPKVQPQEDQETEIEGELTKPEYAFSPSSVNIRDSIISKSGDDFRFSILSRTEQGPNDPNNYSSSLMRLMKTYGT
ncbi:hypothetical protein HK103_003763 [Boothiomyces macroporosus]|uniref:Uncharacterized protein n=1 Tax=Boothiomyces macroporosus TaxID=261099 RepID=A0AAD5UHI5_9FUNG|nr:hypothetical protein HK103_003763 [Boothiomyces macroporosus]